jgi:hypothetical protein
MTTYRKSISNIGLSVGGVIISEGGGDGGFVTITSPERSNAKGGVHGDAVHWDSPNSIYEVTISLLENANANRSLQILYNAQVNRVFTGLYSFSMEDIGTGELLTGQCLITKEPDREKAAEPSNYEWQLKVTSATPLTYSFRSVIV